MLKGHCESEALPHFINYRSIQSFLQPPALYLESLDDLVELCDNNCRDTDFCLKYY